MIIKDVDTTFWQAALTETGENRYFKKSARAAMFFVSILLRTNSPDSLNIDILPREVLLLYRRDEYKITFLPR